MSYPFHPTAPVTIDPLLRAQTLIDARRSEAVVRMTRFRDPKVRQFGVDTAAIGEQILYKERRKIEESEEEKNDHLETLRVTRELAKVNGKKEEWKKAKELETNEIRGQQVKNKLERPKEKEIEEAEIGVASLRVFEGEDTQFLARKKYQHEQVRKWAQATEHEKKEIVDREKREEAEYAKKVLEFEQLALEQVKKEEAHRALREKEVQQTNKELLNAKNQAYYDSLQRKKELEAIDLKIQTNSKLLQEVQIGSNAGPHRKLQDAYKGMPYEEKKEILEIQQRQIKEKELQKQADKDLEVKIALEAEAYRNLALLKEREATRVKAAAKKNVFAAQLAQDEDKKKRYNHLYNTVYTNKPEESYFAQFGTSLR